MISYHNCYLSLSLHWCCFRNGSNLRAPLASRCYQTFCSNFVWSFWGLFTSASSSSALPSDCRIPGKGPHVVSGWRSLPATTLLSLPSSLSSRSSVREESSTWAWILMWEAVTQTQTWQRKDFQHWSLTCHLVKPFDVLFLDCSEYQHDNVNIEAQKKLQYLLVWRQRFPETTWAAWEGKPNSDMSQMQNAAWTWPEPS